LQLQLSRFKKMFSPLEPSPHQLMKRCKLKMSSCIKFKQKVSL
jgi:hypothetical protein